MSDETIERFDSGASVSVSINNKNKPWKDAELVNYLYHEEKMSGPEIADELGCSVGPIYDRIQDTRSTREANKIHLLRKPASFRTTRKGYERSRTKIDGEVHSIGIHRLVMIAEHGIDSVKGKIVHHDNNIPWDNRPKNLELMKQTDHVREHIEQIPPHEKASIFALVEASNYKVEKIGEMFGVTASSVTSIAKRVRDGDYPISGIDA